MRKKQACLTPFYRIFWLLALCPPIGYCAAAQAQSSVQLYGIVDAWVGSQKTPGAASSWQQGGGGMSTSFWGMGGQEDLGGGYKTSFVLEGFFRPQNGAYGSFNGDTFLSRNAYVSLTAPAGTIALGRRSSLLYLQSCEFNPFYASFTFSPTIVQLYSGLGTYPTYKTDQGLVGGTSWSNAVAYYSPDMGGFSANAMYAFDDSTIAGKQMALQASYKNGPLAAGATYQYASFNSSAADLTNLISSMQSQSATQLATSYDFTAVKLYAQYTLTNNTVLNKSYHVNVWETGVAVPLGAGKILAAYGYSRDAGGLDQTRQTVSFGYDYALSKRTDVYAMYLQDHYAAIGSGRTVGVGIRTRF
ncbi:putative porin [Herbaspirillum sp. Sphag1AN]|uniref:porin n=1 Tax=unclassified Herbaspirillum TaxID=2624150 RepID=UPI001616B30D|nr:MULTISPECIES: porin [unclassified Herbaspirillum]MBB3211638.1 putative porin [Herbaspirillum sp. Sphag1AN]MBB3245094.1 putative porin [Herbaspirillum sp. Sphag64]